MIGSSRREEALIYSEEGLEPPYVGCYGRITIMIKIKIKIGAKDP